MFFAPLPFLGLLLHAAPAVEAVKYAPHARPLASATLLVKDWPPAVLVLDEQNAKVSITPAEYQELRVTRAFEVTCILPPNYGVRLVQAWADQPDHLIPVTVLEYKPFNPTYIKLEIDMLYAARGKTHEGPGDHTIHLDFLMKGAGLVPADIVTK